MLPNRDPVDKMGVVLPCVSLTHATNYHAVVTL